MKGIKSVELIEVIKTRTVIGDGSKENPVREVIQYWDKAGKKLAEKSDYEERSLSASSKANSEST